MFTDMLRVDKSYRTLLRFLPLCCRNPASWIRKQCRSGRAWCCCSCCPVSEDSASFSISIRWIIRTSQSWLHRLSIPYSQRGSLSTCLVLHRVTYRALQVWFAQFNMPFLIPPHWIFRSSTTLWRRPKELTLQEMLALVMRPAHRWVLYLFAIVSY